jgi:hypothetical protein
MRASWILGVACLWLLAAGSGAARAGSSLPGSPPPNLSDPFVAHFDENGNGTVSVDGGPDMPFLGTLQPDPLNNNTLVPTFTLPEAVLAGDVLITDVGTGAQSDLLRFPEDPNSPGIAFVMMYYSTVPSSGPPSLSDVGIPSTFQTSFTTIDESLGGGQDGFEYDAGGNVFIGISNAAVPEPSSWTLLAIGGLGLGVAHARRRGRSSKRAA